MHEHHLSASTTSTSHHRDDTEDEEQTSEGPPKPGEISVAIVITAYVTITAVGGALAVIPASPAIAHIVVAVSVVTVDCAAEHGVLHECGSSSFSDTAFSLYRSEAIFDNVVAHFLISKLTFELLGNSFLIFV